MKKFYNLGAKSDILSGLIKSKLFERLSADDTSRQKVKGPKKTTVDSLIADIYLHLLWKIRLDTSEFTTLPTG